jgi:rhodanese-related sulfurtransferase
MKTARSCLFLLSFLFLSSTSVMAQFPVIDAEQLRSYVKANKKAVLVDSRTSEEYQQGHIPGAVNIMPDEMKAKAARLLKDKAVLVIIYCRGID